jgi:hypothetical protein
MPVANAEPRALGNFFAGSDPSIEPQLNQFRLSGVLLLKFLNGFVETEDVVTRYR